MHFLKLIVIVHLQSVIHKQNYHVQTTDRVHSILCETHLSTSPRSLLLDYKTIVRLLWETAKWLTQHHSIKADAVTSEYKVIWPYLEPVSLGRPWSGALGSSWNGYITAITNGTRERQGLPLWLWVNQSVNGCNSQEITYIQVSRYFFFLKEMLTCLNSFTMAKIFKL